MHVPIAIFEKTVKNFYNFYYGVNTKELTSNEEKKLQERIKIANFMLQIGFRLIFISSVVIVSSIVLTCFLSFANKYSSIIENFYKNSKIFQYIKDKYKIYISVFLSCVILHGIFLAFIEILFKSLDVTGFLFTKALNAFGGNN